MDDPVPVVTEPYVEWVLSGEFPQGRPRWEAVGARFVDDVVPWEHRKLWLLNGSHSLMAYAAHDPRPRDRRAGDLRPGRARLGRAVVGRRRAAPAAAAPRRSRPTAPRCWSATRTRGSATCCARSPRTAPRRCRSGSCRPCGPTWPQGRVPTGAARVLAAWVCHLRGQGAPVADVAAEEFTALAAGDLDDAVGRVLTRLGADDPRLHAAVTALARELAANTGATPGNRLPQ